MTPLLRAPSCIAPFTLSMIAVLAAACGEPDLASPTGTSRGGSSATPPAAGEANGPDVPADVPGVTDAPPNDTEAPDENIARDPTQAPVTPSAPEQPIMPEQPAPEVPLSPGRPTRGTTNLFTDLLGIPVDEVDARVRLAVNRIFGIGTNESAIPQANTGYRLYYELPQDPGQAFIWCADANDVRSEGQSYGMMIAVQMNMQSQFDKLWMFAKTRMQVTSNDAWNRYFRWQGRVSVDGNAINVNFGQAGPAPDGDEYFAAALYLADRRWGSSGAINYEQEADAIASAMLNNANGPNNRVRIINAQSNMVVFYPQGNSGNFSDPSYHLPAFYELFAQDGNAEDAERWRQIAEVSRQFFVQSANADTGLHPDYANFNGTPNAGGSQFRFDAWRVPMNMGVDFAWTGADARLQTQVEKYHAFFGARLDDDNIPNSLFLLNGNVAQDDTGPSTALAATLAAGALASSAQNRAEFVENLWNTPQQSGTFRYYQESVYALGLLATAGWYGYDWAPVP